MQTAAFLLALGLQSPQVDSSQTQMSQAVQQVNEWAQIVLSSPNPADRRAAHDSLFIELEKALKLPEADKVDMKQCLKGISVQIPADKSFELYTWQLFAHDSSYIYGGLIKNNKGEVFRLTDKAASIKQPFQTRLKPAEWYGALYYNIVPFEHDNKQMYLLFGYNAHGFFSRRKLIEVLYFDNGKPKFGYNVLEMQDQMKKTRTVQRFIMEYSATVMATLNYSQADDMIIYDHLIAAAPVKGQPASNVPDGSYCGLKLEKGKWVYVDKVHKDDYDPSTSWNNPTAPIPQPVFDQDSKKLNLFGHKRGKKSATK